MLSELVELLQDLDALISDTGACIYPKSPITLRLRLVLERVTKEMPVAK